MHPTSALKDSMFQGRTSQGAELRGNISRMARYEVVVDIVSNISDLHASEVLTEFTILIRNKPVYYGRGIVKHVIHSGLSLTCEITLEEAWLDSELPELTSPSRLREQFRKFFRDWQKDYRILHEYKVVVADIQAYLIELRAWLDQFELAIQVSDTASGKSAEIDALIVLEGDCSANLDELFDRFERVMEKVDLPLRPFHRNYARRHLHPLILCAPFVYRTFFKPLGYAGDYEMVNMIARERFEGGSMYAKLVNRWFTKQAPAIAHRNRIELLNQRLIDESVRVSPKKSGLCVLNLGCGPAAEIQQFLQTSELSDQAQFTLYDFNDETITYAQSVLNEAIRANHRRAKLTIQRKSVQQIIKESGKLSAPHPSEQFDFVYCAGLFDYLTDAVCQRVISNLFHWTAPGGLLLLTNVDKSNPRIHTMESVLEWNLIYRDSAHSLKILPPELPTDGVTVHTDISGVNIVIEIRKPSHG